MIIINHFFLNCELWCHYYTKGLRSHCNRNYSYIEQKFLQVSIASQENDTAERQGTQKSRLSGQYNKNQ